MAGSVAGSASPTSTFLRRPDSRVLFHWGDAHRVPSLLGDAFREVAFTRGDCPQFGASAEDIWELFSTRYGPTIRTVASLQGEALHALRSELLDFLQGYRAADGTIRWGRDYLITRAVQA